MDEIALNFPHKHTIWMKVTILDGDFPYHPYVASSLHLLVLPFWQKQKSQEMDETGGVDGSEGFWM